MKRMILVALIAVLATGIAAAGEKKLMHCFAFTAVEAATDADWQAFFKATDELPGKIPGLTHIWYGKLRRPLLIAFPSGDDAYQKFRAAKPGEEVTVPMRKTPRQWAVCMEFADEAALNAYGVNPAHKEWEAAYGKVRQYGTTTFDLLGQ